VISDPVAVFVVLAVIVYVALRLEERFRVFKALGAALVAILLGMLLSNTGVLPGQSATYGFLSRTGVALGVVLILLSVDIRSIMKAGPTMLAAFGIGAVGTIIGTITASLVLIAPIGDETWKLAGQYTGTYIGGGMNFAALGQAFETSSSLFSAAVAADVGLTAVWLATCLVVPVALGRRAQEPEPRERDPEDESLPLDRSLFESGRSVRLVDVAALVGIAAGAMWLSGLLESWTGIPSILWLTTIALVAAQVPAIRNLPGNALFGNYLIMLFLAANGANSVFARILDVGPAVFYFALITVGLHGIVIFGLGRLVRLDLGTLAVASQANIGGSTSAMALASARGYTDKILPGVAVGLLGNALGNYIGFAVAALVRTWPG
jgi:uncharacterized membrane protein